MRKEDFIKILAKGLDLPKKEAEIVFIKIIESMKEGLLKDKKLLLKGIGIFRIKKAKAKVGRLIKENKILPIPARLTTRFYCSKQLIKKLNK